MSSIDLKTILNTLSRVEEEFDSKIGKAKENKDFKEILRLQRVKEGVKISIKVIERLTTRRIEVIR